MMRFLVCLIVGFHTLQLGGLSTCRHHESHKRQTRSTSKFFGFVVGASSNSKLKADINKQILDIGRSIWAEQSLVTKPYNVGEENLAKIRGTFISDVITNFHGKSEEAKIRRDKEYVIHDVNALTSLLILQCLIEANLYGAAPLPTVSNMTLAVNSLDDFHAQGYPKGSSVLTLWPEQVQKNGNGFQPFPANLINTKVKDGSTYGQLSAIAKTCSVEDCPVVTNGLKGIQKLRNCKEHYSKPMSTLIEDLGAAADFMTSMSNLALGSLLYAGRTGSSKDNEPHPIFPVERKQWTSSNGKIDTLISFLKRSVIKFDKLHDTTEEPPRTTKPQPVPSPSSTNTHTVTVKRSLPSSSSTPPPSSTSTSSSPLPLTVTPTLTPSTSKEVQIEMTSLLPPSEEENHSKLSPLSKTSSSSLSSSPSSSSVTISPSPHPDSDASTVGEDKNILEIVDRNSEEQEDPYTTPIMDEEDSHLENSKGSSSIDDRDDSNQSNVKVSKTNDDNSHVQVDINIRVTVNKGNGKSHVSADKNTQEKRKLSTKMKAASTETVAVKSRKILQAIQDASSLESLRDSNNVSDTTAKSIDSKTTSQRTAHVNKVIKDSDGNIITTSSKTMSLDEGGSSTNSESSNEKESDESNLSMSKQTLTGLIDALIDTLHDNNLSKDVSNTKNTISIDIDVKNKTSTTSSEERDPVRESDTPTITVTSKDPSTPLTTISNTSTGPSPTTPSERTSLGTSLTTNKAESTTTSTPLTMETTTPLITAQSTSTTPPATTTTTPTTVETTTTPQSTKTTTPTKAPRSTTPSPTTTPKPKTRPLPTAPVREERKNPPILDSVSYYSIRKFLDEELPKQDVYLVPIRVAFSQRVAHENDDDDEKEDETVSSSLESRSRVPPPPTFSHFHEVDLMITATSTHALVISSVSGLVDIRTDAELQLIFLSSLRMLTWFMNHQDDLKTMVSLSYFPSRFQLYWMTSRIAFQLNLAPVNESGIFNFARVEIGSFMASMQDKMTLTILSNIKDGGLGADGQTRVFLDDFIGVGDMNSNGEVSGDDRLFTSALAAITLMSTWSSPTFQSDGLLQFHKGTPDSVRIAVNSLVNYVSTKALDPKVSSINAYISEKVKGCQSLPSWYPFNTVTKHTGQDVQPEMADTSLRFGVEGYLTPQEYEAEEKKTRFGIHLPTVREIQNINDPTSVFKFWSSKELTRAVCLQAIAQAADLKVDDV